jgi:5'(3')-deoxyribonucleotidase
MKRVLLDCDGVLADFIGGALEIVNVRFGASFTREDVKEFDFCKSLGLSASDAARIKRTIGGTKGMASSLNVYPGAIDGVLRLREVADVYIVTSPWNSNPTWTYEREAWLRRNFNIHHDRVIHTSAKHVCVGDVFVDDKTETCLRWSEAHPSGIAVQWQTPHNRSDGWLGPSTNDWNYLIDLVKQ